MQLVPLLEKIKARLAGGVFPNEASVSHGIVSPILSALGWDTSDPDEVIPEYTSGRGRVDFALCLNGRRPIVFIEVKGVGRSLDGDRQLFEYAFHEGVPICILTDGREWSFYLPSGQGSYDERRFYRLQIDDRTSAEAEKWLTRYLERRRLASSEAIEAARADYQDVATKRDSARNLPKAWNLLVGQPEDLLVELLSDQTESISGYRPTRDDILIFLRSLELQNPMASAPRSMPVATPRAKLTTSIEMQSKPVVGGIEFPNSAANGRAISFNFLGEIVAARNGNVALVELLARLAKRDPSKIQELANSARGNSRNHIARSVEEIYPKRPDLARAIEFWPGWLVGTNIANREKVGLVRRACEVFGLAFGRDVIFSLPNQ